MAHDVFIPEADGGYSLDSFQKAYAGKKAGIFAAGEVYLGGVSGDDELGACSHTGEEHLELAKIGVLGLVQDDAGFIQGTASHVCQGGNLDGAVFHEFMKAAGGNHICKGVIEGL